MRRSLGGGSTSVLSFCHPPTLLVPRGRHRLQHRVVHPLLHTNVLTPRAPADERRRRRWRPAAAFNKDDGGGGERRQREELASTSAASILNGALLIAGTTVGGGFLALPTVVSPSGFAPSATALVGVWSYFLIESFVVVECLTTARRWALSSSPGGGICNSDGHGREATEEGEQKEGEDDADDEQQHPGIAAAARSAFGLPGQYAAVSLLVLLTEATLVSQISRGAGLLLPPNRQPNPRLYRMGCAAVSLSVAGVVFGPRRGLEAASAFNSALTIVFVVMAAVLFAAGAPAADWSRLSMTATATVAEGTVGGGGGWTGLPRAVPTFLQLLVYGEILPAVCRLLEYRTGPIQLAVLVGSAIPLALEVGWAALGIGLVPPGIVGDPVDSLLAAGPVRVPLFTLAVTAILTTIVGSYLALQSTFDDLIPERSEGTMRRSSPRRRLAAAALIVTPALSIASLSPDLFLKAIDFAGSYPVLLLWGIAPPAVALAQRRRSTHPSNEDFSVSTGGLLLLVAVSLGLFGMCALPDLVFLTKACTSFFRR